LHFFRRHKGGEKWEHETSIKLHLQEEIFRILLEASLKLIFVFFATAEEEKAHD
jgi:hypothetical protein